MGVGTGTRYRIRAASISDCGTIPRRAERIWKSRSAGRRAGPGIPPPFRKTWRSDRRTEHPSRRSVCRPAGSPTPGGCRHPLPACRRRRGALRAQQERPAKSARIPAVWPGRPAIRSTLMFEMPSSRNIATSCATVAASCRRPVRASSPRTNDCTPRLTRFIPSRRQARIWSG